MAFKLGVKLTQLKRLSATFRPNFLVLALVCVFLGVSSVACGNHIAIDRLMIVVMIALSSHISVNAFNEYFDYRSGLDFLTQRTPFSGGSGTLVAHPELASATLMAAIISGLISLFLGIYLIWLIDWMVAVIGLVGLSLIVLYTPLITHSPILSLVSPGLAFGPLMVIGSAYVVSEQVSLQTSIVSLIPFFMVNNLLLLNQFPDIDADRQVGRLNYPILIGRQKSSWIFICFYCVGYLIIVASVSFGQLGPLSLMGLLTLPIALPMLLRVIKDADDLIALMAHLKRNVIINILTPLLLGLGLIWC